LRLSVRQILAQRSTLLLTFAVMGAWTLSNAVGSWLPTYYHDVFKIPLSNASSITSIVTITGVVASISGGVLSMRIGRRRPFLITSGIFMGVFALAAVLFNNLASIFVSVALFGFFANFQNAVIYTIPMELSQGSSRNGAIIFSFMLAGGNFGNFLGPLVVGYAADITGSYLPGFTVCAVISLLVLFAGLLLPETGPGGKKKTGSTISVGV
jgi:MFS family permease